MKWSKRLSIDCNCNTYTHCERGLHKHVTFNAVNYFVYEDKSYRKKLGIFVGSLRAPIVERVVEHFVEKTLDELDLHHDFWFTNVDDHLAATKRESIQMVLDNLNLIDPIVQFTVEIQKESIHRHNGLWLRQQDQPIALPRADDLMFCRVKNEK